MPPSRENAHNDLMIEFKIEKTLSGRHSDKTNRANPDVLMLSALTCLAITKRCGFKADASKFKSLYYVNIF